MATAISYRFVLLVAKDRLPTKCHSLSVSRKSIWDFVFTFFAISASVTLILTSTFFLGRLGRADTTHHKCIRLTCAHIATSPQSRAAIDARVGSFSSYATAEPKLAFRTAKP